MAFEFGQSLIEVASGLQSLDDRGTFESPVRVMLTFVHDGHPKEQVGQGQAVGPLESLGFGISTLRRSARLRLLGASDIRRGPFNARLCHDLFPNPQQIIGRDDERLANGQKSSENEWLSKTAKISGFGGSVLVGLTYFRSNHRGRGSHLMLLFWIFSWLVPALAEARARFIGFDADALVGERRLSELLIHGTELHADGGRLLKWNFAPAWASTISAWSRLEAQILCRNRPSCQLLAERP
jgi:hypothetical protein